MALISGLMFLVLTLSTSSSGEFPSDVLTLIDPEAGLELLGRKTSEADLAGLIDARPSTRAAADGKLSRVLQNAIQNLASSSEKVRESSRKKLVDAGAIVRERIEEIAANDARRSGEAKKILQALDDTRASGAHETDIARIFAIRVAAKKKLSALVPNIEKAAESDNPFVSHAAKDALARLRKKTAGGTKTVVVGSGIGLRDVRALPASANVLAAIDVGTTVPGKGAAVTIGSFFESMTKQLPPAAEVEIEGELQTARTTLLDFVKSYGNMRPERIVVSNFGDVGPTGGGLGIVVHGRYQPEILRNTLTANDVLWRTTEVAGSTVYNSAFLRLVMLNDSSVLILPIMASNKFPLARFLENYNDRADAVSRSERLALFVKTLEQPFRVRGLAITGEKLMKQIWAELDSSPADISTSVKGMRELELTLSQDGEGKSAIRLEGQFDSKESSSKLAEIVDGNIKTAIVELEEVAAQFGDLGTSIPMFTTMITVMKTIKVSAEGKRGIFRMEVPPMGLETVMSSMFMGFGTTRRAAAGG